MRSRSQERARQCGRWGVPQSQPIPMFQNLRHLHQPFRLSKTRVFERARRTGKVTGKNGLKLSQNSFLISASQKVRVRLSFERAYDDQTDKDPAPSRAGRAATSAGR